MQSCGVALQIQFPLCSLLRGVRGLALAVRNETMPRCHGDESVQSVTKCEGPTYVCAHACARVWCLLVCVCAGVDPVSTCTRVSGYAWVRVQVGADVRICACTHPRVCMCGCARAHRLCVCVCVRERVHVYECVCMCA